MDASVLQDEDFADAARFLARVFGGQPAGYLELFEHWWKANPRWTSDMPPAWIVRRGAEVAAFTASIPFFYVIDGASGLCFVTGSTAVAPECRGQGLSKAVGRLFVQQTAADLLVGTGSTAVAHLFLDF
jgi:GNAT superfamily N-acetyltransferase